MPVPVDTRPNRYAASLSPIVHHDGRSSRGTARRTGPLPIVGRDQDIHALLDLMRDGAARLITLVGPAGVGKTRLVEECVSRIGQTGFDDEDIRFVPLQTLRDADLVLPVIASAIGMDRPLEGGTLARLVADIGERRLLLVLDNVEQVVDCAPDIGALLQACTGLTVLATSRRALNLRAEYVLDVAPLGLPPSDMGISPTGLDAFSAIRAFVLFARAKHRDFVLTPENAPAVVALCRRLDGLPLALELAAARMPILSPAAMLRQLQDGPDMPGHGPADLPARQRRMYDAVAWSYDLLSPVEQRWLRRLAVLEGCFGPSMARDVCLSDVAGEMDALEILIELVRANLVVAVDDASGSEPRFRMLETIRRFCLSELSGTGEIEEVRHAYATSMLQRVSGLETAVAHEAIEADYAGIRSTLAWSWAGGEVNVFLPWVTVLEPFWRRSSHLEEGWLWLDRAVTLVEHRDDTVALRADILLGAATMARRRGDYDLAEHLARNGLEVATRTGAGATMARALNALGAIATQQARPDRARIWYEQSLLRYQQDRDIHGEATVLHNLALVELARHEMPRAVELWQRSLVLARGTQEKTTLIAALRSLGAISLAQGRRDRARLLLHEALSLCHRERDIHNTALCHTLLADTYLESEDAGSAVSHVEQALSIARATEEPALLLLALIRQSIVESDRGNISRADLLVVEARDAANRLRVPVAHQPVFQAMADLQRNRGLLQDAHDLYEESLRSWLQGGDMIELVPLLSRFADAARGLGHHERVRRMVRVLEALRALGLEVRELDRSGCQEISSPSSCATFSIRPGEAAFSGKRFRALVEAILNEGEPPSLLSVRERAVLQLLAEGCTNAEIARRLFVSPHTINTHVRRIYHKAGVNSRSAATRFAFEHGFVANSRLLPT